MSSLEILSIIFFATINLALLLDDIKTRKISNYYLIGLILLLPLWGYLYFPRDFSVLLPGVIFSSLLFIVGIFIHEKKTFLGAGDIKYTAILLIFLSGQTLREFVGNIGILTFITLILWTSLILGQLLALEGNFLKKIIFEKGLDFRKMGASLVKGLLDWVLIGFLLYILIEDIAIFGFAGIQGSKDFYFILMVTIFFLRPGIRYLFSLWKHRIIAFTLTFIYIANKIQEQGFSIIYEKFLLYFENIWMYMILLGIGNIIFVKIFSFYDSVLEKNRTTLRFHTFPYSFILFLSFSLVFFFHISLMNWIF